MSGVSGCTSVSWGGWSCRPRADRTACTSRPVRRCRRTLPTPRWRTSGRRCRRPGRCCAFPPCSRRWSRCLHERGITCSGKGCSSLVTSHIQPSIQRWQRLPCRVRLLKPITHAPTWWRNIRDNFRVQCFHPVLWHIGCTGLGSTRRPPDSYTVHSLPWHHSAGDSQTRENMTKLTTKRLEMSETSSLVIGKLSSNGFFSSQLKKHFF